MNSQKELPTQGRAQNHSGLSARSVVGSIVALIGFVGAVIGLAQYAKDRRLDDISAEPLVESAAERHVGRDTVIESVVIAHRIVVDGGVIPFPRDGIWIANEIVMQPDTVIRGENIAIVAKLMRNGRVDASGSAGSAPGAAGAEGGRIFIAARTLEGVAILARGGDGADGKPGDRGADGRSGKCKGFGGYRMAQVGHNGGSGGNGGDGGDGGNGGLIVARVVELGTLSAYAEGGKGGAPGQAGQGGRGGAGCTGLGGSQPIKSNGLPGDPGQPGKSGTTVSTDSHAINYEVLLNVTREHLGQPHKIVEELRKL